MTSREIQATVSGPPPLDVFAAIAAGGAIGATARWAFSEAFPVGFQQFPWSTYAENLLGSFLLGFAIALILIRKPNARLLQPFLGIGVLGSFTTFSNFSHEAMGLLTHDRAPLAVIYISGSILCGLLAASFGILLGRAIGTKPASRRDEP